MGFQVVMYDLLFQTSEIAQSFEELLDDCLRLFLSELVALLQVFVQVLTLADLHGGDYYLPVLFFDLVSVVVFGYSNMVEQVVSLDLPVDVLGFVGGPTCVLIIILLVDDV